MIGKYTGELSGVPSFREGKVTRLKAWLEENPYSLAGSYFYSDSINDLPLLKLVDNPIVVDPDEALLAVAQENHWQIIKFRA